MKIILLIRSLNYGGAERQLTVLAKGLHQRGHQVKVAVFYAGGPLETDLGEAGIPIIHLNKQSRWEIFGFMLRLVRTIKQEQPNVLHGYLGIPNILTALLKPFLTHTKIVWGVRASNVDLNRYGWLAQFSYRIECWLSRFADLIICNSHAGMKYATQHGFPGNKMVVIPNGIDTERFRPDLEARRRIRSEWAVADNEILIGLVARLDPMKDHPTFLKAVALLAKERQDVRFVCVGDGPALYKAKLHALAHQLELDDKLIWAGARRDMPAVYNALDIASSSSYGEGFPNVVAEAMACGVPCVVTDVGDSAWIVGNTGKVVPHSIPKELTKAWQSYLEEDLKQRGFRSRNRIEEQFNLTRLVDKTENFLCL
ncbi:MAG: group 1 glycosyl transferase [Thiotrichaceae bacterium IS1]|nr:MAG: group 1 glycosyl transferase [Thiotrichaceae bacterium IS1]